MKLKDIEGLLPEREGLTEKIKKGTCDTCEHEGDSSQEHCGTCGEGSTLTSNWKEAGWLINETLSKLYEKEIEIDVEEVTDLIQLRYFKLMHPDVTESDAEIVAEALSQAIAKANIIKVKK